MWYKLILLIVTLITYITQAFAQVDSVRSLSDCLELAVANNPTLRQSALDLRTNDIQYKQAKQILIPTLNGGISHGISTGRNVDPTTNLFVEETVNSGNVNLNSGLSLLNGFRILHDIRGRSSAREAGKLEFDGQINVLKLDVITAYIQVLTAEDLVTQTVQQFEVTKERLRNAEVMHREGAMAPGDYYDIKGEYSANLNTIEQNRQILNNTRTELATLLSVPVDRIGSLRRIDIPAQMQVLENERLYELARMNLPQFQAWEWRKKEAESAIKSERSGFFPSLRFDAGLNTRYSSLNSSPYTTQARDFLGRFVSVGLNIPIFNQFTVRNRVDLAKVDLERVKYEEQIALNTLRENTAKAVFDLDIARKNVDNLQQQEQSYSEAFRVAQLQFDLGATNSVIYLTAKNKLENTQNQLVIKRYEWLLQKYINDFYSGSLDL
ncbi:TolC family protein [Sphingobacterium chungjuense]|uniref:TolC family protein n=1 Tax=Sphingobacterium chungjuense TaxID=2675553 RepID=UPI00140B2063|nr:TolC family protein [Sphingobacterium chungjuense]